MGHTVDRRIEVLDERRAELPDIATLDLERDGAWRVSAGATSVTDELTDIAETLAAPRGGLRLVSIPALDPHIVATGVIGQVAASVLGNKAFPVRAILFDKTRTANWSLGWHQDRTIAVKARRDIPGFTNWTIKRGLLHVQPPATLLASMLTLRVHIDDVAMDNAPLLIAPGSHRLGSIAEQDVTTVVARCGSVACLANAGDVWLYATPILHASKASTVPARRRVLQLDYAATSLPGGLEWLGV